MKNIRLELLEDGVGIAYMDMPGRPFNIFSEEMMDDCDELIDTVLDKGLCALVLASAKGTFAAGADLGMIQDFANMRFHADDASMKNRFSRLGQIFRRLEQLPMPTVAAVNGLALGGGLEVALSCHKRVCVNSEAPILGLPEIQLGLLPGAGGTQRLPRLVGLEIATKMLLIGNPVNSAQALSMGLVDAVCEADAVVEEAVSMARGMAAGARWDSDNWSVPAADIAICSGAGWSQHALEWAGLNRRDQLLYPAVNAIINCLGEGLPLDIDSGFQREWNIFVGLMKDPVVANMVVTCFLNKTAASKRALKPQPKGVELSSYHWASSLSEPKKLSRKLTAVEPLDADVVIVDTTAGSGADNEVILLPLGPNNSWVSEADASRPAQTIGFVSDLPLVEAVEVLHAGDELTAKAVALALAKGKIPVLIERPEGVLKPVLDKLAACLADAGDRDSLLASLVRVELDSSLKLIDNSLTLPTVQDVVEVDPAAGLNVLAEMALVAYGCLIDGAINDPEMLDVLMVYGLGFPKWTGGAISFLTMLQRGEIASELLSDSVRKRVSEISAPLKEQAVYLPVARSAA